jgi:hypothetical protein
MSSTDKAIAQPTDEMLLINVHAGPFRLCACEEPWLCLVPTQDLVDKLTCSCASEIVHESTSWQCANSLRWVPKQQREHVTSARTPFDSNIVVVVRVPGG